MDREALHGAQANGWLTTLCSQLRSCQTTDDVADVVGALDQGPLFGGQIEDVLDQLRTATTYAHLQELLLAASSWSPHLSKWLIKSFPASAEEFLSSSHGEIIERVSLFLQVLNCPLDRRTQGFLTAARKRSELSQPVLKALLGLDTDRRDGDDMSPLSPKKNASTFQKGKARDRKGTQYTRDNNKTDLEHNLETLGFSVPTSEEGNRMTIATLLAVLKEDLQGFLWVLQDSDVRLAVLTLILRQTQTAKGGTSETLAIHTAEEDRAGEGDSLQSFARVLPVKAALYFNNAPGFGEWRLLISSRAEHDLRQQRNEDASVYKIVIKKLRELSNGQFSPDNQRALNGSNADIPIYRAILTGSKRLVYQIDCVPEYGTDIDRQVIKIFGIYTHDELGKRLWASLGTQLALRGRVYKKRCVFRNKPHHDGDYVILPASFPRQDNEDDEVSSIVPKLPAEDLEDAHQLLVLEKYVTLSKELLTSIYANLEVSHIFDVTPQENEIIDHPFSCYVLGRSGTGKTTTMLFKMLGRERAYLQGGADMGVSKPRQLFVTQSRVLATRVKEYCGKLIDSLSLGSKTKDELLTIAEQRREPGLQSEAMLFDFDDDTMWKADLPQKFSLLEDRHFPLFLSFDKLRQLLEGDLSRGSNTDNIDLERQINYLLFLQKYWPHFPQDLTKNIGGDFCFIHQSGPLIYAGTESDSGLAFSEFLGVIEGSEEALSYHTRYVDSRGYTELSHRRHHVFSNKRDKLYALFESYLRLKRARGEFDSADRTHRILKAFESIGIPGSKIDYLYVDEAQDNLMVDAMLLRSICRNPNGLFWAGDTAQTIAVGSSFRLDDLKAFLYRLEERRQGDTIKAGFSAQDDVRLFQLTVNYRSHAGIVRCASAVIELITHWWPYAIDSLSPEQGIVDGAKPFFFSEQFHRDALHKKIRGGNSGMLMEFGAQQCVLVRDEDARDRLREQVGEMGLVLTLYESKGLEFDDVLLYDFFEDSPVDLNVWRVVLNQVQTTPGRYPIAPRFDPERHASLCRELKFLYVAITRSRKTLWIFDCSLKAEPMKAFWSSKGFIEEWPAEAQIPSLTVRSSSKEWETVGRSLFQSKQWDHAKLSFERAGLSREANISTAHALREEARRMPSSTKRSDRRSAFRKAGKAFLGIARISPYREEKRVLLHNAGECFEAAASLGVESDDYRKAGSAYTSAEEFDSATKVYVQCDLFDEAVQVIQENRTKMNPSVVEQTLHLAKLFYFKKREYKKARALFSSDEQQIKFLRDNHLSDEHLAWVLANMGRYQDAANEHLARGRTKEAIEVIKSDCGSDDGLTRAAKYSLDVVWQKVSFGQKLKASNTAAIEFLKLASTIKPRLRSPSQRDQLTLFNDLRSDSETQAKSFRRLAHRFLKAREKLHALVAFDHLFATFPDISNISNSTLIPILSDFLAYCQLVRGAISASDIQNPETQKIFGFHLATLPNTYQLRPGSLLEKWLVRSSAVTTLPAKGSVVFGDVIKNALPRMLKYRLEAHLVDENQRCKQAKPFRLCLQFLINRHGCVDDCSLLHISSEDVTERWLSDYLRIHLLQIQVYEIYHSSLSNNLETIRDRRYWIHSLWDALHPLTPQLGPPSKLSSLPEFRKAFDIVQRWSIDILGRYCLSSEAMVLTFLYEAGDLCFSFDHNGSRRILESPLLDQFKEKKDYHRIVASTGKRFYVVPELYNCLQASDERFIFTGVLFVKQVVFANLKFDANALCHLVEFITSAIIYACRDFKLNGVTLPRTWVLHLLRRVKTRSAKGDLGLVRIFLRSLAVLLDTLGEGGYRPSASYLLLGGSSIVDAPPGVRHLLLSRICRCLALLGIHLTVLRDDIMLAMRALLTMLPPSVHHEPWRPYQKALHWGEILKALQSSYDNTPNEHLIQLCCASTEEKRRDWPAIPGATRVVFETMEVLPTLLSKAPSSTVMAGTKTSSKAENVGEETVGGTHESGQADDYVLETPNEEAVDSISTAAKTATRTAEIPFEKWVAGMLLARLYRRALLRRRAEKAKRSANEELCESFFNTCFDVSTKIEWPPRSTYKMLFLGLVPHLLTCVHGLEAYLNKREADIESRRGEKGEPEIRSAQIAELTRSRELSALLSPGSEFHTRNNIEDLKCLTKEVANLIASLPSKGAELSIQVHLQMAMKGIAGEEPAPADECSAPKSNSSTS